MIKGDILSALKTFNLGQPEDQSIASAYRLNSLVANRAYGWIEYKGNIQDLYKLKLASKLTLLYSNQFQQHFYRIYYDNK